MTSSDERGVDFIMANPFLDGEVLARFDYAREGYGSESERHALVLVQRVVPDARRLAPDEPEPEGLVEEVLKPGTEQSWYDRNTEVARRPLSGRDSGMWFRGGFAPRERLPWLQTSELP